MEIISLPGINPRPNSSLAEESNLQELHDKRSAVSHFFRFELTLRVKNFLTSLSISLVCFPSGLGYYASKVFEVGTVTIRQRYSAECNYQITWMFQWTIFGNVTKQSTSGGQRLPSLFSSNRLINPFSVNGLSLIVSEEVLPAELLI